MSVAQGSRHLKTEFNKLRVVCFFRISTSRFPIKRSVFWSSPMPYNNTWRCASMKGLALRWHVSWLVKKKKRITKFDSVHFESLLESRAGLSIPEEAWVPSCWANKRGLRLEEVRSSVRSLGCTAASSSSYTRSRWEKQTNLRKNRREWHKL